MIISRSPRSKRLSRQRDESVLTSRYTYRQTVEIARQSAISKVPARAAGYAKIIIVAIGTFRVASPVKKAMSLLATSLPDRRGRRCGVGAHRSHFRALRERSRGRCATAMVPPDAHPIGKPTLCAVELPASKKPSSLHLHVSFQCPEIGSWHPVGACFVGLILGPLD
jgi:hypothetical protein